MMNCRNACFCPVLPSLPKACGQPVSVQGAAL